MLERYGFMTDTQAIGGVTFDFKGTRVGCFVSGSAANAFILGAKCFKMFAVGKLNAKI